MEYKTKTNMANRDSWTWTVKGYFRIASRWPKKLIWKEKARDEVGELSGARM